MTNLIQELMAKEIESLRRDVRVLKDKNEQLNYAIRSARNVLVNGHPSPSAVEYLTMALEQKP